MYFIFFRTQVIINTFFGYIDFTKVILTSGADFPDTLSGTALVALKGNPIILTGECSYSGGKESANDNFIETLIGNEGIQNIYALGLEGSISEDNLNSIVNIEQALDLVKSQIELEANESIHIPFEESRWITTYNGDKCYCIVKDYNETGDPDDRTELCEYLVNISTGQVTQCIQGQYTPIS